MAALGEIKLKSKLTAKLIHIHDVVAVVIKVSVIRIGRKINKQGILIQ